LEFHFPEYKFHKTVFLFNFQSLLLLLGLH